MLTEIQVETSTQKEENELKLKDENNQLLNDNRTLGNKNVEKAMVIERLEAQAVILQEELEYLKQENARLKNEQLCKKGPAFNIERFYKNDQKILYYTGFETYALMNGVYNFILPPDENNRLAVYHHRDSLGGHRRNMTLSMENQFFLTMIRVRRGFTYETLGDLFGISKSSSAKICLCWIDLLFTQLPSNIELWRPRDILIKNAPLGFQQKYTNVVGSIDCTEFYIEKPSSLVRQSQCYSNYKSATTMKSLVMTDPSGAIIYFSPLFTGSISDNNIIVQSGFLDILREKVNSGDLHPGDVI